MIFWIINIGLAFLLCVICAGFLIPQILLVAYRKKLFDEPDERKIHKIDIPRLGGFAFKPVIFLSMALLFAVNLLLGNVQMLEGLEKEVSELLFLFSSIMILYLVGMADDLVGIRYKPKFVVQILCGIFLIAGGVWFNDLHGIFGINELTPYIGYPLTVLAIICIINSINLIDGVDGLASSLCGCALVIYGIVFFEEGQYIYSMLSFATLGVLVPFFYYNVFGNPEKYKKIFMGDTGSLTIGMMICFLSIKLMISVDKNTIEYNPIILAFSPLFIPCFDVFRVYFRRVRKRKNPFLPDKSHIHHKLLALGMKHRIVMLTVALTSIFVIVVNIYLSKYVNITLLLIANLAIWTLANIWLSKRIIKINKQEIN